MKYATLIYLDSEHLKELRSALENDIKTIDEILERRSVSEQ